MLEEDPTRAKDIPSERLVSKVQDMIRSAISPKLAHFKRGFYLLKNENVKRRILFLTAVGEVIILLLYNLINNNSFFLQTF